MRKKWTVEDEDNLIKLKSSGYDWDFIAYTLHSTASSVRRRFHYLQQEGKANYKIHPYESQLQEMVEFVGIHGHRASVKKYGSYAIHYLKRNGLWTRKQRNVPCYPELFLVHQDRYYWSGFIAADGCVKGPRHVNIGLAKKDREQLIKLQMSFGGAIYDRKEVTEWDMHKAKPIIDFLASLGIGRRKTKSLQPPNDLSEEESCDFIRGYFDGDGCVTASVQKRGAFIHNFTFLGTEAMLGWIRKCFSSYAGCKNVPKIVKSRGIFQISYGSDNDFLCIGNWLYSDSKERLERKYNRYLSIRKIMETVKERDGVNWHK